MSRFAERIDTHSHFVPPVWRHACEENGHANIDGMPGIPSWSEQAHLDMMDSLSISKSILSITSPGVHLVSGNDEEARRLARACNDFAADLKRRHPTRFGFWAALPLPDVDGSIAEARRALDELGADGLAVLTNHHGIYLGNERFQPLWAEISARRTPVFVHPTTACAAATATTNPQQAIVLPQYPRPMFEFLFDTARAAIDLFLSGTMRRNDALRFILAHGGGALPPLIERMALIPTLQGVDMGGETKASIEHTLRTRFYFDLAGFPYPAGIAALQHYVGTDRLLYGSDYCLTPRTVVAGLIADMENWMPQVWESETDRQKILTQNARELLSGRNRL